MRVTQTISIGSLRINTMSNSSILQVGASGSMQARAKEIREFVTPAQAEQKLETIVSKELNPIFEKEGLPLEDVNHSPTSTTPPPANGSGEGAKAPPSPASVRPEATPNLQDEESSSVIQPELHEGSSSTIEHVHDRRKTLYDSHGKPVDGDTYKLEYGSWYLLR